MGDFNEVVDPSKKVGGNSRSVAQMEGFRSALSDCLLGDLGYCGSWFTWSNKRASPDFAKERLDRALTTIDWCNLFPKVKVNILAARSFDHKLIIVCFKPSSRSWRR